ncbi:MAG: paaG [Acidobacteria bacterium]|jgi:enoyl-CoA hydratase|nr:paaG [Acidobacteriota bacterium]
MGERDLIVVEARDGVRVVQLQRGANPLDGAMLEALDTALAGLEQGGAPPVVIASRHPSVFCPGLDLKDLEGLPRDRMRALMRRFNGLIRRVAVYPGPTVAALSGHAIGGGCLLALACDRRVMARSGARLGLSEVNLGIPLPAGSTVMLTTLYPARGIEQLVLEGDGFGGERAFELGLVERLVEADGVVDEACRLAAQLGSRPHGAYATAKRYLRWGLGEVMAERDEAELECFLDHWYEPETQDRIAAIVAGLGRR